MKKILIIQDDLAVGGMERFVLNLCNHLDPNEFSINLLLLSDDKNEMISQLKTNIKKWILPNKLEDVMSPIKMVFLIPSISAVVKEVSPDIIHTHSYQFRLSFIQMGCLLAFRPVKFIHTIHTTGIYYENKTLWHSFKISIEKLLYLFYKTTVVGVSEPVYLQCKKNFSGYKRLYYINNGIDTNYSSIKKCVELGTNTINIVYVARLDSGKNHKRLLEAVTKINNDNIRLYLLGEGPLKQELYDNVESLGISEKVVFMGNRSDVKEILAACHIGVFPSLYEGLSLALLEMAAAGLPIVCSDILVFRKLLSSAPDNVFFDPYDSEDIMSKIENVIGNAELRRQLSKISKSIASNYTINKMAKEYSLLYESL